MSKKLLMSNSLTPQVDERIFAEYTFNNTIDSNCLPTSLTIVGGYEVTDEVNGNITRRILRNADGNKPTLIRFTSKKALLTVDNLIAQPTEMNNMFDWCSNLTSVNLSGLDTSKATSMYSMFRDCSKLTSLDLSNFNTSRILNMNTTFYGCSKLTSLDLSSFDTSRVTRIQSTFGGCTSLTSLDLSNFDTSRVINMIYTFYNCYALSSEILISNPNISSYSGMFNNTSTNPNAKFTVRYTDEATKAMAEKLVATKSSNSNVVLADAPGL